MKTETPGATDTPPGAIGIPLGGTENQSPDIRLDLGLSTLAGTPDTPSETSDVIDAMDPKDYTYSSTDIPRSDSELKKILDKLELSTDDTEPYPGLIEYMSPFFEDGNEEEKAKLDKTATLVMAKALLHKRKYKELEEWLVKKAISEEDDNNYNKWACSAELSDLIFMHDPNLSRLAASVYPKYEVPEKEFTPNHKCKLLTLKNRITLPTKSFLYLLDIVTDIIFMVKMFTSGSTSLGGLSLFFIVFPMVLGNTMLTLRSFSFRGITNNPILTNKLFSTLLNILQLRPMFYSLALLSHTPKPLWIVTGYFAEYSTIRYVERMIENIPQTLLQTYVLTRSIFYIRDLDSEEIYTPGWGFFHSTLCSLIISLILFPKSMVDKEETHRKADPTKYDLEFNYRVCWCAKYSACCKTPLRESLRKNLRKCRVCRWFHKFEISIQSTYKYIIYFIMILSRLVFINAMFMFCNAIYNFLGKYNIIPLWLIAVAYCYRYIYYLHIFKRPIDVIKPTLNISKENFEVIRHYHSRCNFLAQTQLFIPNNDIPFAFPDVFKKIIIPHFFVIFEMLILSLCIAFSREDLFLGVYTDIVVEWFAVVVLCNTGIYCIAVVLYLIYWITIHPDNDPDVNYFAKCIQGCWKGAKLKQKAKWKIKQEEKLEKYIRENKGKDVDYETKRHGCGLTISCEKEKKVKDKKDKTDDGCCSCINKCKLWCYNSDSD